MARSLEMTIGAVTLITALVSATAMVENRYAKAAFVVEQLDTLYSKTIKLRILELQLKPADQFTTADRALLEYLKQELREATGDSSQ